MVATIPPINTRPLSTIYFLLSRPGEYSPVVVGQVISLASVSRRDRGAYLCIASNGVPPAVSHRISLEVGPGHNISSDTTLSLPQVVFPPSLALDQDTAVARPGANLRLGCSVEAVPEPVMSWATNNRAITKGGTKMFKGN